jgi:hypothetical protein
VSRVYTQPSPWGGLRDISLRNGYCTLAFFEIIIVATFLNYNIRGLKSFFASFLDDPIA